MQDDNIASVSYRGIRIQYSEDRDQWTFELRGSTRWAKTLSNAKASIDKPAPSDKKPFEPIDAYDQIYEGFKLGKITSIAERTRYQSSLHVWFVSNGSRSKERLDSLIAVTPENEARIAEYKRLTAERKVIDKRIEALKFDPPKIGADVELPEEQSV